MTHAEVRDAMRARRGTPTDAVLVEVENAIRLCCGVKRRMAKHFEVEEATVRRWVDRHERLKTVLVEEREKAAAERRATIERRIAEARERLEQAQKNLSEHWQDVKQKHAGLFWGEVATEHERSEKLMEAVREAQNDLKTTLKARGRGEPTEPEVRSSPIVRPRRRPRKRGQEQQLLLVD